MEVLLVDIHQPNFTFNNKFGTTISDALDMIIIIQNFSRVKSFSSLFKAKNNQTNENIKTCMVYFPNLNHTKYILINQLTIGYQTKIKPNSSSPSLHVRLAPN